MALEMQVRSDMCCCIHQFLCLCSRFVVQHQVQCPVQLLQLLPDNVLCNICAVQCAVPNFCLTRSFKGPNLFKTKLNRIPHLLSFRELVSLQFYSLRCSLLLAVSKLHCLKCHIWDRHLGPKYRPSKYQTFHGKFQRYLRPLRPE